MNIFSFLLHWLVITALVDWLIGRSLTRLAIFMPKPPAVLWLYDSLGTIGLISAAMAGLLSISILLHLAWQRFHAGQERTSALIWLILVSLSAGFLFIQPGRGLMTLFQAAMLLSLLIAGWAGWKNGGSIQAKLSVVLPTLALSIGLLGHIQIASKLVPSLIAFQTAETFFVLSPVFFWLAYGRGAPMKNWLIAFLPALAFSAGILSNPEMTGILVIWSIGLTLFLPWPIYAASLWLGGVTILSTAREDGWTAKTLLLLAAGGVAPQLNIHAFLGLIALLLFSLPERKTEQSTLEEIEVDRNSKKILSTT
jgi:hypothetical protein